MPNSKILRLVLGDQLNPLHSWFSQVDARVVYVLMEIRQETDYVLHHAQKVLGIFAAMRDFAKQLQAVGHQVTYLAIDDAKNQQSLIANLDALLQNGAFTCFEYQAPDEYRLDQQLTRYCTALSVNCRCVDSEHFYTQRLEAAALFGKRNSSKQEPSRVSNFSGKTHPKHPTKNWLMEHFYRHMRTLHNVLMTEARSPEGGHWNYDPDNRNPWRGHPPEPADTRPTHNHSALWQCIQAADIKTFGNPEAEHFRWPLNRREALQQLEDFIKNRLPYFGQYQDAMSAHAPHLFHSLLSFALNVKMLSPREVVAAAEMAYKKGNASLPAVEGFIRQILGWREYVRGVYWAHMPDYTQSNALQHTLPLPEWFWTGKTHLNCLSHAITQSLEQAYAHHIQRLMIIGNFALLAGLEPNAVHNWYLGIYIDAFEWVEAPNTLGMSQFADGGLLATKPYVSSAAYIDRMSDYCKTCRYQQKKRSGAGACPFNILYWHFFLRHEDLLNTNPRLAPIYRTLQTMTADEHATLRKEYIQVTSRLETL